MKKLQLKDTRDYSIFKNNPNNRELQERHVKQFMTSIRKYGQLMPIITDSKGVIHDGQHRFEAVKRLGLPIIYMINNSVKNDTEFIVEINNTAKGWNVVDFAHHHMKNGNKDIGEALTLAYQWKSISKASYPKGVKGKGITLNMSLELLKDSKASSTAGIKNGTYKSDINKGVDIFNFLLELQSRVNYDVFTARIARPLKKLYYLNGGLGKSFLDKIPNAPKLNPSKNDASDNYVYFYNLYNSK